MTTLGEKDAILARLRETVEQTKALFEGAKVEYDRARERMNELGSTHPDGSMRHASHVYNHMLRIYMTALHQYNRYLLHGELPQAKREPFDR